MKSDEEVCREVWGEIKAEAARLAEIISSRGLRQRIAYDKVILRRLRNGCKK